MAPCVYKGWSVCQLVDLIVEMMSIFIFCGCRDDVLRFVHDSKSRQEESGHFSSRISSLAQHVIDMLSVVKTYICNFEVTYSKDYMFLCSVVLPMHRSYMYFSS